MNIEIADRLCKLRKQHGLSQEELAEKLDISRQAVSKWERAESSPDTDNLILLSRVYGVTIDDMLFSSDPIDSRNEQEQDGEQEEDNEQEDTESDNVDKQSNSILHSYVEPNSNQNENYEKYRNWNESPFPLIAVIAYLYIGFDFGWWHPGWLIILAIPLYYYFGYWLYKNTRNSFPYPLIILIIYLCLGFFFNWWHPTWILFLTIPIFYWKSWT